MSIFHNNCYFYYFLYLFISGKVGRIFDATQKIITTIATATITIAYNNIAGGSDSKNNKGDKNNKDDKNDKNKDNKNR